MKKKKNTKKNNIEDDDEVKMKLKKSNNEKYARATYRVYQYTTHNLIYIQREACTFLLFSLYPGSFLFSSFSAFTYFSRCRDHKSSCFLLTKYGLPIYAGEYFPILELFSICLK